MEAAILISALSLFAGVSLIPAVFLILRERRIALDPQHHIQGGRAVLMALALLGLAVMFLLNAVAQDGPLLLARTALLVTVPLAIVQIDRRIARRENPRGA